MLDRGHGIGVLRSRIEAQHSAALLALSACSLEDQLPRLRRHPTFLLGIATAKNHGEPGAHGLDYVRISVSTISPTRPDMSDQLRRLSTARGTVQRRFQRDAVAVAVDAPSGFEFGFGVSHITNDTPIACAGIGECNRLRGRLAAGSESKRLDRKRTYVW